MRKEFEWQAVLQQPARWFCRLGLVSFLLGGGVWAQSVPDQAKSVPQELQPPAGEQLVAQTHAKGDQIYTCKEGATTFLWTLKAPDAQLFAQDGKVFGKHFAGPSWQAADGSTIVGRATANASPNPESIPWLLITVISRSGQGVLSGVTSIQRLNTKGGKAPGAGCDAAHAGQDLRIPYQADYLFFSPK